MADPSRSPGGSGANANVAEIVQLGVLDLFAGAGGISEGFRRAGYTVLGGADIDPDAAATYATNFPEAHTLCGDLRQRALKAEITELARAADVLVGGPPCQAFSQVRNHRRVIDDPKNSLYRDFVAVLRESLPSAFLVENVPGVDQLGVREQIAADLALDDEYDVQPQIVNSADFGVPQTRNRLVFVGVRRSVGRAPIATGTGITPCISLRSDSAQTDARYVVNGQGPAGAEFLDVLLDPHDLTATTAAQAISDLVGLPLGNRIDEMPYSSIGEASTAYQHLMREGAPDELANTQVPRMNVDTQVRLDGVPPGGNHLDLDDRLRERYLSGQRWGPDAGTGRLARRHYYAYRRLHPNLWSWTLNTKADAVYHYEAIRALSVREFARLHSFPDRFRFTTDPRRGVLPGRIKGGPAHSRYRQVGNAVPPLLAAGLADAIAKSLAEGTL